MGDWDYRIQFLEPKNVVAVVAGSQNSLAICGHRQDSTFLSGSLKFPFFSLYVSAYRRSNGRFRVWGFVCVCVCVFQLYTWGRNQRGTLGHPPETKTENIPSLVDSLSGVKIVQAAIGGWHCLAVDNQGLAYAWVVRKMEELLS